MAAVSACIVSTKLHISPGSKPCCSNFTARYVVYHYHCVRIAWVLFAGHHLVASGKESTCNGDMKMQLSPGSGRSYGGEYGNPLVLLLESPHRQGAW